MDALLRALAAAYAKKGGRLYLVGGAVRAQLMGAKAQDWDLCGDLSPEEAKVAFSSLPSVSIQAEYAALGTLRLRSQGKVLEYTSFRRESYRKGHRPASVAFTKDIGEDAQRRDFTIGCLYWDIAAETLLDPTEKGISDLQNGLLRTVRGAETLREDGLRILRLARFAAQLGFSPVEGLVESARENAGLLADLEQARCREELTRLFVAPHAAKGIALLQATNAARLLFPSLSLSAQGMEQAPPSLALRLALAFFPQTDVLPCLQRLCFPKALRQLLAECFSFVGLQGDALSLAAAAHPEATALAAEALRWRGDPRSKGLSSLAGRSLPRSSRELDISGEVLAEALGLMPGPEIGRVKEALWRYIVLHPEAAHDQASLLEIAQAL